MSAASLPPCHRQYQYHRGAPSKGPQDEWRAYYHRHHSIQDAHLTSTETANPLLLPAPLCTWLSIRCFSLFASVFVFVVFALCLYLCLCLYLYVCVCCVYVLPHLHACMVFMLVEKFCEIPPNRDSIYLKHCNNIQSQNITEETHNAFFIQEEKKFFFF